LRESQLTQARAASIGFIFQSFNLIPTLSAQENVETALVPLGVGAAERQERAYRALADVSLGDRARHLPSELSGASSSGSPSPAPWSSSPRCCWPTNPPATSTKEPGTRS
jgi:predicted ABC-type transport system involved in lysophospholipase L1 biosynthesis ATPase subunit